MINQAVYITMVEEKFWPLPKHGACDMSDLDKRKKDGRCSAWIRCKLPSAPYQWQQGIIYHQIYILPYSSLSPSSDPYPNIIFVSFLSLIFLFSNLFHFTVSRHVRGLYCSSLLASCTCSTSILCLRAVFNLPCTCQASSNCIPWYLFCQESPLVSLLCLFGIIYFLVAQCINLIVCISAPTSLFLHCLACTHICNILFNFLLLLFI